MKSIKTTADDPISWDGRIVQPDELEETENGIDAVLPNDTRVTLVGWDCLRVGSDGAELSSLVRCYWYFENERPLPCGTYKLLMKIPSAVKEGGKRREQSNKPFKQWMKDRRFIGSQCLEDPELLAEILETGIDEWLAL